MTTVLRRLVRACFPIACAVLAALPAHAEVTRVDIRNRADALGGRAFGSAGAYEVLSGTIYFAVDPANPHNRVIVDLDKAPRNAQGRVEFSSDIVVIKPKDQAKGNGVLFFDVVNRGNKGLLQVFSRAVRGTEFRTEAEFGDAYLLKQGYTLVFVGWQHDIAPGKGWSGSPRRSPPRMARRSRAGCACRSSATSRRRTCSTAAATTPPPIDR
ncbi:MAG TPA: hypothetical protein VM032_06825 [Vicinamibacterales bacterium]|nr:hypothetical protein [Vicinamibacterales bacterium]